MSMGSKGVCDGVLSEENPVKAQGSPLECRWIPVNAQGDQWDCGCMPDWACESTGCPVGL